MDALRRVLCFLWYNCDMKTIVLEFKKRVKTGQKDGLNDPIYEEQTFSISDCLIAPITEPLDRIESSALDRDIAIVRIHLPKSDSTDISDSSVDYGGQTWRVVGKPVAFMNDNTPTIWNRYVRAEAVNG